MKFILAAFLSALTLTASAAPHRVRPRRHRPVKTIEVVRKIPWQTVAAGGVAAGTVIAAYKISDGVEDGLKTVAEEKPESFSVNVPGLSKPLIGEFDCVVTDGKDTCIVDWKTSSAKWAVGKADKDLQATAFCYAFKEKHGEKPLFRFDVVTKAKTPTVNNHYTLRADDELNRFVSLANQIEKSVNSGNFYPNETGFGCGECPYADRCKKWGHSPNTKRLNHSGSSSE